MDNPIWLECFVGKLCLRVLELFLSQKDQWKALDEALLLFDQVAKHLGSFRNQVARIDDGAPQRCSSIVSKKTLLPVDNWMNDQLPLHATRHKSLRSSSRRSCPPPITSPALTAENFAKRNERRPTIHNLPSVPFQSCRHNSSSAVEDDECDSVGLLQSQPFIQSVKLPSNGMVFLSDKIPSTRSSGTVLGLENPERLWDMPYLLLQMATAFVSQNLIDSHDVSTRLSSSCQPHEETLKRCEQITDVLKFVVSSQLPTEEKISALNVSELKNQHGGDIVLVTVIKSQKFLGFLRSLVLTTHAQLQVLAEEAFKELTGESCGSLISREPQSITPPQALLDALDNEIAVQQPLASSDCCERDTRRKTPFLSKSQTEEPTTFRQKNQSDFSESDSDPLDAGILEICCDGLEERAELSCSDSSAPVNSPRYVATRGASQVASVVAGVSVTDTASDGLQENIAALCAVDSCVCKGLDASNHHSTINGSSSKDFFDSELASGCDITECSMPSVLRKTKGTPGIPSVSVKTEPSSDDDVGNRAKPADIFDVNNSPLVVDIQESTAEKEVLKATNCTGKPDVSENGLRVEGSSLQRRHTSHCGVSRSRKTVKKNNQWEAEEWMESLSTVSLPSHLENNLTELAGALAQNRPDSQSSPTALKRRRTTTTQNAQIPEENDCTGTVTECGQLPSTTGLMPFLTDWTPKATRIATILADSVARRERELEGLQNLERLRTTRASRQCFEDKESRHEPDDEIISLVPVSHSSRSVVPVKSSVDQRDFFPARRARYWTDAEEKVLIDCYNRWALQSGPVPWSNILEDMQKDGVWRSRQQCHDKLKSLLHSGCAERTRRGEIVVLVEPRYRPRSGQAARRPRNEVSHKL